MLNFGGSPQLQKHYIATILVPLSISSVRSNVWLELVYVSALESRTVLVPVLNSAVTTSTHLHQQFPLIGFPGT